MTEKIILASASPRRRELLEQIHVKFEVRPAKGEEVITAEEPAEVVKELSLQKAAEIAEKVEEGIVIGADTVVAYDGKIMGKPKDEQDAARMLQLLSGHVHEVYTGVTAILCENGQQIMRTFSECTQVEFALMSEEEISFYIKSKEPMDKAGAYGIQGLGARYIRSIQGDYNNVVGLPVGRLYREVLRDWMGGLTEGTPAK